MAEEAKKEEGEGSESPAKKKIDMLMIALCFQLVGLLAATGLIVKAAFFTKGPDLSHHRLTERAIASIQDDMSKVQLLDLKEFRVNLPQNHFLKADIQLEISDPETTEFINSRMAAVKSGILEVLALQNLEKTSSFQGKLSLKEAVRDTVNHEIGLSRNDKLGVVREVYFGDLFMK